MTRLEFHLSLFLTVILVDVAHAASPACGPVMDAFVKMQKTPVHQYMLKGTTPQGEMVAINGRVYIMVSGKWQVSPMKPEDRLKMTLDTFSENVACSATAGEVNGEAATLYRVRKQPAEENVETQIWVSKSRGLPLKQQTDLGGADGKNLRTIRFDYTNVQVPPGVQ